MKKFSVVLILILSFLFCVNEPVKADTSTNSNNNSLGIVIDGKFDDWKDKPITQLFTDNDQYNIKQASLLADTQNIYFYLDMASLNSSGYNTLQTSSYLLTIKGQQIYLTFSNTIPSGGNIGKSQSINVSGWNQMNNASYSMPNTQAIETRQATTNSYTDIVEIAIPYADLGLNNTISDSIAITIKNDNLGSQTIHTNGGSTGPIVLSGVGLSMALLGFFVYKRKQHKLDCTILR